MMKASTFARIALVLALVPVSLLGQTTSAKRITRSVAPPASGPTKSGAKPAPAAASTSTAQPRLAVPAVAVPAREKTPEEKAEAVRKTIEFQKARAAEGSSSAQYDLGMRYLNGDGLEKNPELAKKWLQRAADQDHTQAKQQLQLLNKK